MPSIAVPYVLLCLALAGCVSYPDYPESWPARAGAGEGCGAIAGAYANAGWAGVAPDRTGLGDLTELLFPELHSSDGADRVELRIDDGGALVVAAFAGDRPVRRARYGGESPPSCDAEGLRATLHRGTPPRAHQTVGYGYHAVTLARAADGSLAVRTASGGVGATLVGIFFVPVAGERERWYRFPPVDPRSPKP